MAVSAIRPPEIPPIVSSEWVLAHDDVILCDVRSTMTGTDGRRAFEERHLPNAVYVSLDADLAGAPAGRAGRHPLPDPDTFAAALGALGIDDRAIVVAYDERGGAYAARLVWMLRIIGQPSALLDGGLDGWTGEIASGPESPRHPVERRAVPWPDDAVADADGVSEHLEQGGVVVDSRDPSRFAGETEPIDAVAGHVPGAINLPFVDNLGADGRFREPAALAERFGSAAVDGRAIVYCGSGVTACHNALAVEYAGLGRPAVYVGSWSGWSSDPERPVATGTE